MSMNEKWNKGISLRKKRWISMIMATIMIVTLVPFMPGKKAGKVEAAGYNIAAAVAYAKEWGGSKRNPAYKEYDGDCANFVSQCLKAGGLNVYDTWVPTLKDKLQAMGYTIIMNPTADQVDVGDVMFYDSTYTGEINHTTIITSKVNGVPKITGHTSDVIDGYYTNGSACPWQYGNYTCAAILHTSGISGEMTTPTITTNRECYIVGDKINITWNKTSSQSDFLHYWLIITNTDTGEECFGGATGSNGDVNANSYQFTIPEEGHYRIDIYAIPYNDKEHRQKEAVKTVSTYVYDSSIVNLGDDFYANIINTGNGKCLTADSDDNVTIRTASGQQNQLWHFRKRESGSYEIINNASDKALDDANWGQENETNVGVYTRNNTTAQKWFVRGTDGAYFINASCGDAVLDIDSNGSADGTNVWLYEKNESSAQKFTIKKVATSLDTCNALGLTTIQGGFRLSWDTVSGATKYEVYRKKATDSDYSRIAVVSGEDIDTYEDKNCISGITYEYRVNAANDYCLGASGAECHGLYLDSTNASLVKYSADSVNISWDSVRGADGYNIYLYNQNDDTYSKVKDIANGSTTSCVISGLKQYYIYLFGRSIWYMYI